MTWVTGRGGAGRYTRGREPEGDTVSGGTVALCGLVGVLVVVGWFAFMTASVSVSWLPVAGFALCVLGALQIKWERDRNDPERRRRAAIDRGTRRAIREGRA